MQSLRETAVALLRQQLAAQAAGTTAARCASGAAASTSGSTPFALRFLNSHASGGAFRPAGPLQQAWQRHMSSAPGQQQRKSSQQKALDTAMYLTALVVGMVGLSYASVPLYQMFCQATGYGGTVRIGKSVEDKIKERTENPDEKLEQKAAEHEIRVWFTSEVAEGMPWKFTPTQDWVTVRPGQSTLAFFTAENLSDKPITGVSTYNVVPDKMGYYFNKIQCFCFEEQRLRGREVVDMPVFFYIDPEVVDDTSCRKVRDITLAYTFFKSESEEVEDAEDASSSVGSGVKLHGPGVLPPGVTGVLPSGAGGQPAAAGAPGQS